MGAGPADIRQDLFPASRPSLSLLTVPGVVEEQTDGRWLNGIATEPERCSLNLELDAATTDFPYWWTCPPDGGTDAATALSGYGGVKAIGDNPANVLAEPFDAWVGWKCSSLGMNDARRAEVEARLLRHLEACLPAIVERELWTGQVAEQMAAETPFLADNASATTVGTFGHVSALAEMEQALADCTCGGRHVIHAQRRVVTYWRSHQLVSLAPDRTHLLTELGTVVVPGTGYPGTGPTGDAASYAFSWVYGTGMARVFLGDPFVNAVNAETVTRPTNDVELRAERPALALFDPCCHIAIRVASGDLYNVGGS